MSEYKKTALVLGAGGFIGSHMVKRLRSEGYWVRGVDVKRPEFSETEYALDGDKMKELGWVPAKSVRERISEVQRDTGCAELM